MKQRLAWSLLLGTLLSVNSAPRAVAQSPLRVDLNPIDDRRDVLSRHAENWRVVPAESIAKTFGTVAVTLRRVGDPGGRLTWG